MSDDDDAMVDEAPVYEDRVASRCEAYRRLLETLADMPDGDLRKDGFLMLKSVRLSFKTLPTGELRSIDGGKMD